MYLPLAIILLLVGLAVAENDTVLNNETASISQLGAKETGQLLIVLSELRVSIEKLDSSMKSFEDRLNHLETERQNTVNANGLKTELDQLKQDFKVFQNEQTAHQGDSAGTTELKTTVTKLSENVGLLIQESRSQFPGLRADLNSLRGNVQDLNRRAVTDIKLGPVEYSQLWRGVGYFDHVPYVITEVGNFNADQYPDSVKRRRIQKLVNGSWRDAASG
ncbi:Tail fiber protein S' [Orchesella cincta]|uniref:Tail fiber protein S n=1 Tax=Orchesella cincta TaxID=48709 RepID=A0A1D2MBC8_ORCCI|nr:Tail fiber protein S' [Orchesella cincta]